MSRIKVIDMAMKIAHVMAERSEDPWTKVGAVALTPNGRIIATAYNGLLSGFTYDFCKHTREHRFPFMVHAEQNLCSLLIRNTADRCVITHNPCSSCLLLLATFGFQNIYYHEVYERDNHVQIVADFYKLKLIPV